MILAELAKLFVVSHVILQLYDNTYLKQFPTYTCLSDFRLIQNASLATFIPPDLAISLRHLYALYTH